ncbi:MAG: CCA tRNA nucleotidyltransferase [Anaerolineae bacterium]|nr:CCA tRNA nucleotidyltransferase [Anaerolineae bacterium]
MNLRDQITAWLAGQDIQVYLVGGCVRDRLLGRPIYDLDVAVAGDGLHLARRLADRFGGAYYPLDEARGTGRAILHDQEGEHLVVDVARLRGHDLAADLADRDLTINALAASVRAPEEIIDLHGGLDDLRARTIRPVSEASIRNDPLRALRAVRQAAELGFALAPQTELLIRRDGAAIASPEVAGERIRDELARLLALPHSAESLARLDDLGLLTVIFPELAPLRRLPQPPPHHLDVLPHSLKIVDCLEQTVAVLEQAGTGDSRRTPPVATPLAAVLENLRPFAARLRAHLAQTVSETRPRLVTLKLAALLHDTGKAQAYTQDGAAGQGRIRFIGHDRIGAGLVEEALRRLRFSAAEVRLGKAIARHHMRPLLLARQENVSSRTVYRFYRDTEQAGVDLLIHALADHLATYAPDTGEDAWRHLLSLAVRMLGDYWERPAERVTPPELLNGHDLMEELGLRPGPHIGELLEAVREAQVSGQVRTREEALALVAGRLG